MLPRKRFSFLSIKVGMLFSKLPLTPNQWTLISVLPAIVSAYFIINENFLLGALLFGTASFLDLVDGSVARVTGRVTKKGAYLDTIIDRYIEGLIVFGLLFVSLPIPNSTLWIVLYLFGSMMTTYAKAAAKEKNLTEEELRGGLTERAERLVLLFLGLLLANLSKAYLSYIVIILAVLSNATALQRIYIALRKKQDL
ncbi:MAG: CDP-alcohol phosphatidyltransferase family protein [Candidatus Aenigmarchaeota archaeon]|nr:CDP-alcohol phosphatidyltransferase family protein [Candidatus Aenigmarchaeota archaeon]